MFYLYHSNDLELLKGLLEDKLQNSPVSPFETEHILVQNQGMTQWLKLQLAQGMGIAAQIDFPLPSKFIWQMFNALSPELPKRTHFDKQIMAWKLMSLLPQFIEQPEYAPIANYLKSASDELDTLKCYQLSQTIADIFDQYLIYRPEWLLAWEAGDNTASGADLGVHAWQPALWRALVASTPSQLEDGTNPQLHRAKVHVSLKTLLETNPEALQKLPKRLFVFGIATLPKVYFEALLALSSKIEIHFYLHNPCNEFWSDLTHSRFQLNQLKKREGELHLEVGNPLLASWGKLGREFLSYVQDEGSTVGSILGEPTQIQEFQLFYQDDTQTPTLLSQVQQDILELKDGTEGAFAAAALEHSQFKRTIVPEDKSIRLVNGHSPLRELQRLYDQILYWLDTDPSLKPRDIVVMVPDINQYAPYIDAVFGSHKAQIGQGENLSGNEYRIPWAIADQSVTQENPVIESFLTLLDLPNNRFFNNEIIDLLSVPAIARRFELSSEALDMIRGWVHQAQVRWGLDEKQRAAQGMPSFAQNSWRKGLKQLLLGAILPNHSESEGFAGDFPVFATEGHGTEELGKLIAFIDALEDARHKIITAAGSVEVWQTLIIELLDIFYAAEEEEVYALQTIRAALENLADDTALAEFIEPLPSAVVLAWFNEHLSQQTGWQRFLSGPVNFCSLMPMRSIPFKAICMLGMNDTDYPRKSPIMGFDLMHRFPQKGDRNKREDDRYLFLEAVCSAQKYLYISYRGRSVRTNSEQQPSVLVAELKDYMADSFCLAADAELPHEASKAAFLSWLEETLPLQAYHPSVFNLAAQNSVPSYQTMWAAVAQAEVEANQTAVTEGWGLVQDWPVEPLDEPTDLNLEKVAWSQVIEALQNPAKFFVRHRLQTSLEKDWDDQETANHEPFSLNKLEAYQLKTAWFEQLQTRPDLLESAPEALAPITRQKQALGKLPVKEAGQLAHLDLAEKTQRVAALVFAKQGLPAQQKNIPNKKIELQLPSATSQNTLLESELQQACYAVNTGEPILVFYRVGSVRGKHLLEAWLHLLFASLQAEPIQKAFYFGLGKDDKPAGFELNAPQPEESQRLIQLALGWYWASWCKPVPHFPDTLWQILKSFAQNEKKKEKLGLAEIVKADFEPTKDYRSGLAFGEAAEPYFSRCLAGFIARIKEGSEQEVKAWLAEYGELMQALFKHTTELKQDDLEALTTNRTVQSKAK